MVDLQRISIGGVELDEALCPGKDRSMTAGELKRLGAD